MVSEELFHFLMKSYSLCSHQLYKCRQARWTTWPFYFRRGFGPRLWLFSLLPTNIHTNISTAQHIEKQLFFVKISSRKHQMWLKRRFDYAYIIPWFSLILALCFSKTAAHDLYCVCNQMVQDGLPLTKIIINGQFGTYRFMF